MASTAAGESSPVPTGTGSEQGGVDSQPDGKITQESSQVEMQNLAGAIPSMSGERVAREEQAHDGNKPTPINTNQPEIFVDAPSSLPKSPASPRSTDNDAHKKEVSAIGASTEGPVLPVTKDNTSNVRVVNITLLLTSGARHPYKLTEEYLSSRNINNFEGDPFNISVYTLKELIWREWREEWEARSSSPSSIRLIHFGRLLDDKTPLKDCRFNADGPNVVHMTVRPAEVVDEEDARTGKKGILGGDRDGNERTPRCRCTIL